MPLPDSVRMSLRWFLFAALLIAGLVTLVSWVKHQESVEDELLNTGANSQEVFWVALAKEFSATTDSLEQAAAAVAEDPGVQILLLQAKNAVESEGGGNGGEQAERIRQDLRDLMLRNWARIARIYNAQHLHFYLSPDMTTFLRMPNSEKYGDSVQGLLSVLAMAAKSKKTESGIETGRIYSGFRAVSPVVARDPESGLEFVVGFVEVGDDFNPTLQDLRQSFDVDSAMFLTRKHADSTLWTSQPTASGTPPPWADDYLLVASTNPLIETLYRQAGVKKLFVEAVESRNLVKPPSHMVATLDGFPYLVFVGPFRDSKSNQEDMEPVGVFVTWMPIMGMEDISRRALHQSVLNGVLGFIITMTLFYITWRFAARRWRRVINERTIQLKTANVELSRAEQRYRGVFDSTAQGIFRATNQGRFVSANSAMARLLGYDSADKITNMVIPATRFYFHPKDQQQWLDEVLDKRELVNHEVRFMNKSGQPVWVLMNAHLIGDETGKPFIEGTVLDITARKTALEAREQAEKKYRSVIAATGEGFVLLDPDQQIVEVNQAILDTLGLDRTQVIGRPIEQFLGEGPCVKYGQGMSKDEEKGHYRMEVVVMGRGGESMPHLLNQSVLRDESGNVDGYVVFLTNVSEQKRTECALREAQERFQGIFQNAVQGIFQSALSGKLLAANTAYAAMLGYDSPDELMSLGDLAHTIYFDPDIRNQWIEDLKDKGSLKNVEITLKHKDGSPVVVLANLWLGKGNSEDPHVEGIIIDWART